jgi:hypothetical protein
MAEGAWVGFPFEVVLWRSRWALAILALVATLGPLPADSDGAERSEGSP